MSLNYNLERKAAQDADLHEHPRWVAVSFSSCIRIIQGFAHLQIHPKKQMCNPRNLKVQRTKFFRGKRREKPQVVTSFLKLE